MLPCVMSLGNRRGKGQLIHLSRHLCILSLVLATACYADEFLGAFRTPRLHDYVRRVRFMVPNERYPERAIPIYSKIPRGVCLSVGTERAFMLYALAKNCTHLILLDSDPMVVRLNDINIRLIDLAASRLDYVHLRLNGTWADWKIRIAENPRKDLPPLTLDDWYWWRNMVREESGFRRFHQPSNGEFANVNYLYRDDLYDRIATGVQQRRFKTIGMDLTDFLNFSRLIQQLRTENLALAAADLSNVWWKSLVGATNLEKIVARMKLVTYEKSLLILTDRGYHRRFPGLSYFAFSMGFLDMHSLSSQLAPLTFKEPYAESSDDSIFNTIDGQSTEIPHCSVPVTREHLVPSL